ncbi:MAG: NAD(P)H-hydrate dehydratase [Candidatus Marinimicrobia bacterium]|nr:NAD(P)H-hydrate dehydratase [Candidatus Neomarinimicrobiota bacterium]MCF7880278.1 NAD(P)H-hydrate dehydratase [Candidatus Neomarinimicrobiota bacterium]
MKYALTREGSRAADNFTINELGLPGMVLMESAGRAVVDIALDILDDRGGFTAYILAGKGNNGGDGFVVARYLLEAGVETVTFHTAAEQEYSGDALTNFRILKQSTNNLYHIESVAALNEYTEDLFAADVLIDGLLGTGITGAPREPYNYFIEWLNSYNAPTVSIDIPSGIDANTGQMPGTAVSAVATVTMGFLKAGLLFSPGRDIAGEVHVADIGIPESALDQVGNIYHLPEADDIYYRLPVHASDTYKHRVGKFFSLCGARGFTGAAALVNRAALVSGAGLLFAGVPESLNNILETKMTEVITVPLPETSLGTFSAKGMEQIKENLDWSDVLAIGSGITGNEDTMEMVSRVLSNYRKTAVVDADAATYFSGETLPQLKDSPADLILTPHWGEFARITGYSKEAITEDRLQIAQDFARDYEVTLVLKGAPTILASNNGTLFINTTGNAGMATAGTGDVLTGMIAGFAAQGLPAVDAALVGMYLHGLAGDLAAENLTRYSVTAGALIDYLPEALTHVGEFYDHI